MYIDFKITTWERLKIASEGTYGKYKGCKSLESKLLKYKQLK